MTEEGRAVERELEQQLQEQRDSLAAIEEALASDASNPELLSVHQELAQSIKDVEEGLFHLKHTQLSKEDDAATSIDEGVGVEERAMEQELEFQLEEQKKSLAMLNEALASDSSNLDLLSVHGDLLQSIKDIEKGLLHLKRSRLLREVDGIASIYAAESTSQEDTTETLDINHSREDLLEPKVYSIGSRCRFRHSNGRWYDGHIVGIEGADSARVSFSTPTSESMLMCKFSLQQRCRFGNTCRMSHGLNVPISYLKEYLPTTWKETLVGSKIWVDSGECGIWKEAELVSWDDKLKLAEVIFQDGIATKLEIASLALSEFAQMSDEEQSSSDIGYSEEEENVDDGSFYEGIGFVESTALQRGVQTDTALFAKWENHTRGIASKMMASMGYREGMGLGVSGQGIIDPIAVKVLPPKQSLDHAIHSSEGGDEGSIGRKKRSRGGKRKRDKKFAEAARAAKVEQGSESDVFGLINQRLVGKNGNDSILGNKQKRQREEVLDCTKNADRKSLVSQEDKVKELRLQVEKLKEMMKRNRNDRVVYEAASRRLKETHKELTDAKAAHASVSNAVVSKEKEKKWLKF